MPQFWYGAISSKEFEAFAVSVGMKPINSLFMYIIMQCNYIAVIDLLCNLICTTRCTNTKDMLIAGSTCQGHIVTDEFWSQTTEVCVDMSAVQLEAIAVYNAEPKHKDQSNRQPCHKHGTDTYIKQVMKHVGGCS